MDINDSILVEAESFENVGGWVIDQQFMDVMGSPYLLAHGLGTPVEDATTRIKIPQKGKYRVWVRTFNWVADFNTKGAPGQFQIKINGSPLQVLFGTEGAEWHWQDGGIVDLQDLEITINLHDLTGFEGRCDAILFTMDVNQIPPNNLKELKQFRLILLPHRAQIKEIGEFDLIVVGGGIAGICTAISAARLGCHVALIHDRPVVGGNNSSDVRVWLGGDTNIEPFPHIGDLVNELEPKKRAHQGPENTAEIYEDAHRKELLLKEHVNCFLNFHVNEVVTISITNNANFRIIKSIIAENIRDGTRVRLRGKWFSDCSGDAVLGYLAGADYDITSYGHLGQSNLWNVVDTGTPQSFPRCSWAFDLSKKPFPGRKKYHKSNNKSNNLQLILKNLGTWFWESGFYHDPILDDERNRDNNFLTMYGAWDCLKNIERILPTYKLNWAAYISGRRESRRLLGDIIIDLKTLKKGTKFPDGCVPTGWKIDIHLPDKKYNKGFKNNEFISKAFFTNYPRPFWIPYRSLYSRNILNLFMAGRNISVTHEALGTIRVMRTGGMMGEIVGMAVSICKKYEINPKQLYESHLDELLMLAKQGVGKN